MVKLKKFFYLFISILFISISVLPLTSCKKNEIDKVSKGLTNYEITASLDENMKITGSETVNFVNETGKNLSKLCFHLYPRAFRENATIKPYTTLTLASCFPNGISYGDITILKVLLNGHEAKFEIVGEDEDIMQINFDFELENKNNLTVCIDFEIIIPNCTHRFGYYDENVNLGNWYPIICEFENGEFDTTPYFATGDPFFSNISNYKVIFSYPEGYLLSSTGEIQTNITDEISTSIITAKAVRDFAMSLSKKSAKISSTFNNTTINYVGYNNDENLQKYLTVSLKAVEFFNKSFGVYPYATLTVVKTPFIYGGMEYPNIVFISDAIDDEDEYLKVIVHEIAHQWWYGIVGNNETTEAWLDESLSEYSTALFFKNYTEWGISYDELIENAISSYTLYVDVIQTIRDEVNTKMNLAVNEYQNDYEYSYMVYVKGVIMFDELNKVVGDNKLIAGLKKYYNENKFKIASKLDFYSAFESACHKDLEGFFEGYLEGKTIITNIS